MILNIKAKLIERYAMKKAGIGTGLPKSSGVTSIKRKKPIIISLTSFPARIKDVDKTILSLLKQDVKPDKVILWLATTQFPKQEGDLPPSILKLKKFGLEIGWYNKDIRSYKKLIPTLRENPDAVIVTVDDDWYYSKRFLKVLLEEHEEHPRDIICNLVTHPQFDEKNRLRSNKKEIDYRGTSSYFNKQVGSDGVLYPPYTLDEKVLDEDCFMKIAPTNDDIWLWAMAVKKGTKIRLAKNPERCMYMTNAEIQTETSLNRINSQGTIYEDVTNAMLNTFPEIFQRLKEHGEG